MTPRQRTPLSPRPGRAGLRSCNLSHPPLTAPFDGVSGGAERCLLSAQQLIISWLMMNSDLPSRERLRAGRSRPFLTSPCPLLTTFPLVGWHIGVPRAKTGLWDPLNLAPEAGGGCWAGRMGAGRWVLQQQVLAVL